jgi:DNA processing protein
MDALTEQHWLVLHILFSGNNRQLLKLHKLSPDPETLLNASARDWLQAGVKNQFCSHHTWREQPLIQAQRQQKQLRAMRARVLALGDADYPRLLREIPDPPVLLYVLGDVACLSSPLLGVVGSRKASAAGQRAARDLCADLVGCGLGICSGLALGIDAAAHRASLEQGGQTVAVMATGLDRIYPAQHGALAKEIVNSGAIVTEFPLGSPPTRERFPQRNRIISGLSLGVLVVEAAQRSGSLITARMAMEQNREVFALPHSIHHTQGRGCNRLLKEGACLVRSAQDIVQELGAMARLLGGPPANAAGSLQFLATEKAPTGRQRELLRQLGDAELSIDEIVLSSELDATEVMQLMTEMQLQGWVENRSGLYSRC